MNDVLKTVLSMSLSGGIVIVLLLCLSRLFGKKLSRQWQYYIWLIAVIRLLVPFASQQNLMDWLFQTAEAAVSSADDGADGEMPDEQGQKIASRAMEGQMQEPGEEDAETQGAGQYAWLAWLIPAWFLFARKITIYESFLKYIRAGSEEVQDMALLERFGKLVEESHVRGTVSLSVNGMAASPMMIGFFAPCLILPSAEITDTEFAYTVLHELVHHRRRDICYKWLVQFAVCIHWFNPLAYVLQKNTNRACELSCDEAVIQGLDGQERRAYGDTLLHMAGRDGKCRNPVSSITFSESKKHLKERLDAIMDFQEKTKGTFIMTVILTVLLFIGTAYMGVYAAGGQEAAVQTMSRPGTSAQAAYSALYKGGVYYILFKNVDENDIPSQAGPDYGISFAAVWPDVYIGFRSYHINKDLTKKVEKECAHMRGKGWLTKEETDAILAVAAKVQEGDTGSFQTDGQEEEYALWKIGKRNGAYYYKNRRVRILMDMRKDRSFENLSYDGEGKTDLKIVRDKNNSIKKVTYLSKKKAKKILADMKED